MFRELEVEFFNGQWRAFLLEDGGLEGLGKGRGRHGFGGMQNGLLDGVHVAVGDKSGRSNESWWVCDLGEKMEGALYRKEAPVILPAY